MAEELPSLAASDFHILLALLDGDCHGYAIMLRIEEAEGERIIGPATLYTSLQRLLRLELVAEADAPRDVPRDDARRRYYRITPRGRRAAAAEARRLEALVRAARRRKLLTRKA